MEEAELSDMKRARGLIEDARAQAEAMRVEPSAWIMALFGQLVIDLIETAPHVEREVLLAKCHETFDRLFHAYPKEGQR